MTFREQPPTISTPSPEVEAGETESVAAEPAKRRIPLASIPTTISIGLVIAVAYLGTRIFTAHRAAKPAPAAISVSLPVPPPPPVVREQAPPPPVAHAEPAPVAPKVTQAKPASQTKPVIREKSEHAEPEKNDGSDTVPTITPQSGQRFIQVGALELDAEDTRKFVRRLRSENYDPHIAPGPTPALMRVLIGPFDNLDALNAKKAQLETEGIQTFVRKY